MTTNAKELFSGGIPLSHSCLIVATTSAHVAVTLEYLQDFERAVRVDAMKNELAKWLDAQDITSDNIGSIRRQCFVPWDSVWNSLVRDETANRENKSTQPT